MIKEKQEHDLHIDGRRQTGIEVRQHNVRAAVQLANILKSSFGPRGLDKMLVSDLGEITITNDGAKILSELAVEHPAARVLVQLAKSQDQQVGDGTTSVVLVAAELLKEGLSLIENDKIHPSNVIAGFRMAMKEAKRIMKEKLIVKINTDDETVKNLIKTSMNSKILGQDSDHFAEICTEALKGIKSKKGKYNLNLINYIKRHGKSMKESKLVDGFALEAALSSQLMPKVIKNAKIALLDTNLHRTKLKLGISVEIVDPKKLEAVRQKEIDIIKKRIDLMLEKGVNVILTTQGIDDMCSKFLIEKGCMGIRRVVKGDLVRLQKLVGGRIISEFTNLEGIEQFTDEDVGYAGKVSIEKVADDDIIFIRECKMKKSSSLIIRGANDYLLEEMERTLEDALNAAIRVLETSEVVPGGGAVEGALSIHLEDYAKTIETREQLAITHFAEALLVVPKTLCINAALDSTELVAKLRAFHNKGLNEKKEEFLRYGLDLENKDVIDNLKAGVVEPALIKLKIIEFATESAISILRIDDLFRLNPKKQEQQ